MDEPEHYPESDRIEGIAHPRETRTVSGQDAAIHGFLDAWRQDRLHHAWLLRGPKGVGKATLAYRIARALIAAEDGADALFGGGEPAVPTSLDTPEGCPVQARIEAQSEPRLFVLRREWDIDKKRMQTRIAVDNVRELRRFLGLSAADGGWRVVVIDPIDDMNTNSANALLKFLEEPPAKCVFLIVCHAPAGLLPTIRSRCRTLDLSPLAPAALAEAIAAAGARIGQGEAAALAALAGGSVGQSLALSAGDGLAFYGRLVGLLGRGQHVDRAGMMALANACAGRQNADRYLMVLSLIQTLVARLARAAATGSLGVEAAPGEAALADAVARHPAQATHWAEALTKIAATTRHAVAVNLDPAQCVIDTLLELDATLARVRSVAA